MFLVLVKFHDPKHRQLFTSGYLAAAFPHVSTADSSTTSPVFEQVLAVIVGYLRLPPATVRQVLAVNVSEGSAPQSGPDVYPPPPPPFVMCWRRRQGRRGRRGRSWRLGPHGVPGTAATRFR